MPFSTKTVMMESVTQLTVDFGGFDASNSFLSGDARWAVAFGAVALVSMFLGWPKREAMERLAAEVPPIV